MAVDDSVLACPTCGSPLRVQTADWVCSAAHRFNRSRDGYVNLLVTHQRRATAPGDSREMIAARRAFLEGGHFDPLRDALRARGAAAEAGRVVLDCGCGEGYYTRHWSDDGRFDVFGIDIAKVAVRYAARRSRTNVYCVASAYHLPVLNHVVDTAIVVFAPLHPEELARVLRAGGRLLVVNPGPHHLWELKARLFPEPTLHGDPAVIPDTVRFRRDRVEQMTYTLTLTAPEDIGGLVTMTPYGHRVPTEVQRLATTAALTVTADFLISEYVAL